MIRVLFDTNVLLSAILFGGLPGQLLLLAQLRLFTLVTSPTLLDELYEKLRGKFRLNEADLLEVSSMLEKLCEIVSTTAQLNIIKADSDDDRVLECALAGRADYIVSGDKHLRNLAEFRGIRILTIRHFMDLLAPPA